MDATPYSPRLGAIAEVQFQAALRRLGLGEFVRAEPVAGGLFGQNVFVTSTRGEWVLRGAPHAEWQLPAERFFARLLHEHTGAPIPWPYLVDPREDIFGWSYALMPRMPGLPLSDRTVAARLPRDDRIALARAMGANLAQVHELTWDHPGQYTLATDTITPLPESWADWLANEVRDWLTRAKHSDRTTDSDVAWVGDLLATARHALMVPFQPRIVLRDYGEHNVVVRRSGDGWQVSGMFDFMEAAFGDSELDLSRQVAIYLGEDREFARAYLWRYLEVHPPRQGFEERFAVYMLRDRLIIWEYAQRPSMVTWWDPGLSLREWAEPYTSCYNALLGD